MLVFHVPYLINREVRMHGFPLECVNDGLFGSGVGKFRSVGVCCLRFVVDDDTATVCKLDNKVKFRMARQRNIYTVDDKPTLYALFHG